MRILLVIPQDEEIGGVASTVGNLAKYLRKQGHEVFFFHPAAAILLKKKTTRLGFPGFDLRLQMPVEERHPLIGISAFLLLFPILLLQLIRVVLKYRIQVINVHYPMDRFAYFALCRRILPIALITSVHGADVFPDGRSIGQSSRSLKFLLASSDRIVAPSWRFQKHFLTAFPELSRKTIFIHNGVNLAELAALGTDETGHSSTPYVLCISGYKEQKAIDVLVRAFKLVNKENPSTKLILVGAGHLRGQLEALAISLGINEQIEFLGPQGRTEIARLLRGCEIFVLPSRFETFGIVILEAMAYRKAVIATTVGGIPEIIESGKNGILVEPDNPNALAKAINSVLLNQELRGSLAHEGYLTVRKDFRSEQTGSAYECVFERLLSSASKITRGAKITSAGQL